MSGRGAKSTQRARAEQERSRLYAARTAVHNGRVRRRFRDNTVVGIAGGIIVVASLASQFAHAEATAPAPEPTETRSPAPQVTLPPRPSQAPTE